MSDLIDRQAAIDALTKNMPSLTTPDGSGQFDHDIQVTDEAYVDCMQIIHDLPSAQRWIPVSERLPKEHESIWAKAKGTERWSESMWEKQSDEVIVTELFEDGTTRTDTACTHDGEWYVKIKAVKRKIIAWMPLPEPWRGEEG